MFLLLLTILFALPAASQRKVDHDRSADFGGFDSYFVEAEVHGSAGKQLNALDETRFRQVVIDTLNSEGLSMASRARADLVVRLRFSSDVDVVRVRTGRPRRAKGKSVRTIRDKDAVLRVELRHRTDLVWSGEDDFDPKADPEKRTAQMLKIVKGLFKDYPPNG